MPGSGSFEGRPRVLEDDAALGPPSRECSSWDSSDDALLRRFSGDAPPPSALPRMAPSPRGFDWSEKPSGDLREMSDQVMDTSALNVHDLKRLVQARFSLEPANAPSLSVMSFGYRYGVPPQADLVLDVRFLPNPYFVPDLKGLNGMHERVFGVRARASRGTRISQPGCGSLPIPVSSLSS